MIDPASLTVLAGTAVTALLPLLEKAAAKGFDSISTSIVQ